MAESKINTTNLNNKIEKILTDANIGSYEAFGVGEDYFDDAENIYEIKEQVSTFCNEYNEGNINIDMLFNSLFNIEVVWNINIPWIKKFYPCKNQFSKLGNEIFDFDINFLKKYMKEGE